MTSNILARPTVQPPQLKEVRGSDHWSVWGARTRAIGRVAGARGQSQLIVCLGRIHSAAGSQASHHDTTVGTLGQQPTFIVCHAFSQNMKGKLKPGGAIVAGCTINCAAVNVYHHLAAAVDSSYRNHSPDPGRHCPNACGGNRSRAGGIAGQVLDRAGFCSRNGKKGNQSNQSNDWAEGHSAVANWGFGSHARLSGAAGS